jgi:hypothetical protein
LDTGSKPFSFHDQPGSGIAHSRDDCTHSLAMGDLNWNGKPNTRLVRLSRMLWHSGKLEPNARPLYSSQ